MGENDQIPVDPDFAGECFKEGCVKSSRQWLYVALVLLVGLFVPKHANAQAVRFDTTVDTTSSTCVSGKQCPLLVIPGATVSVCGGSVTTLSSCLASPATTYTDYTAGTPCPSTGQLTPATGGACLATSDAQGGAGFWALPGQYNYFLRVPATAGGGTYGPYPINVGASAGCPLGATCDASFATLPLACTAAGSGTLYLTRNWNGLTTQTLACNIQALANGIIKPASGQTVTLSKSFSGTLTQHFDYSSGGSVALTGPVPMFYPEWFGATGAGVGTCDTTALQNAINAAIGRTMVLSESYGVCSPGVILNAANAGITVTGALATPQTPGSTPQGGLIATTSSPATVLLTNSAFNTILNNLYLDCNGKASTNALEALGAGGGTGLWTSVTAHNCSGDGVLISGGGGGINNNELQIINLHADNNGGYGIHETPQTDANALMIFQMKCVSNTSGCELWEGGSVNQHIGGNYEGDGGPPITIGLSSNSSGPSFGYVGPLLDVEEGSPSFTVSTSGTTVTGTGFTTGSKWVGLWATINNVAYQIASVTNSTTLVLKSSAGSQSSVSMTVSYNSIVVNCANSGEVHSVTENSVVLNPSAGSCGSGGNITASGTFIEGVGTGSWVHNLVGYIEQFPGSPGTIKFFDSTHTLLNTLTSTMTIVPGGVAMQFGTGSITTTNKVIQYLQPNFATDNVGCSGADNAICATITDTSGSTSWFQTTPGTCVTIYLGTHTLRAGANTLTLNGTTKTIASHFNSASNIGTAYPVGSVVPLCLGGSGWLDMSQ